MIIKRIKKRGFVVIDNKLARDRNLSLKAKGLMIYLLSLPGNWEVKLYQLESQMKEGIDAIRTGLNELMVNGYVKKVSIRKSNGQFNVEYYVTEFPEDLDRIGLSALDEPHWENRIGKPTLENPRQQKKEEQKKEEQKKEEETKEKRTSSSDVRKQLKSLGVENEMIDLLTDDLTDDFKIDLINTSLEKVIKKTIDGKINRPQAYAIKTVKNILNGAYVNLKKEKEKLEKEKREKKEKTISMLEKVKSEHRKEMDKLLRKGAGNV